MKRVLTGMSVLVLSSIFSPTSFAIVDMKNANYSDVFKVLDIPGAGFNLMVEITYNSRSLHNGRFGYGWCSNFETDAEVQKDGAVHVKECGDGVETVFRPKSGKITSLKDLKEGVVLTAEGQAAETLTRKGESLVRAMPEGASEKFDLSGNLTQLFDRNGNYLKFGYKGELVEDAVDNNGRKLSFTYLPNTKKVKEIVGPNKMSATFEYKNVSDLTKFVAGNSYIFSFDYDDLHNMTKINFPDNTTKKLTYDQAKDWVTSFTDRDGCTEKYNYELSKDDPKNHYWSTVEKKCDGKVTNNSRFEFWYKDHADKTRFLERVVMDVNGEKSDITYHPIFGRPLVMKKGTRITKFTYLDSGLVHTKLIGKDLTEYTYDKSNKVVKVAIGKRVTTFAYDTRGNPTVAKNSNGQIVSMEYDRAGRLIFIKDQAKRQLKITYEEKFGKPRLIERIGIGTLSVSYKPSGEVDKVDSDGGPTVAVQVSSTFNNLIDVVAPAGIELGL